MTATYMNKYFDGTYNYYDIVFEESDTVLLRLNGVVFNEFITEQDKIDRASEIAKSNLLEYELIEIMTN